MFSFFNKGLINIILSARFWIPFSRINYSTYIVHIDVINVVILNIESPIHYTTFTLVCILSVYVFQKISKALQPNVNCLAT